VASDRWIRSTSGIDLATTRISHGTAQRSDVLLTALVLTLGTLVVLFSGPYLAGDEGEEKY
jgi:hypothetical protein